MSLMDFGMKLHSGHGSGGSPSERRAAAAKAMQAGSSLSAEGALAWAEKEDVQMRSSSSL